MAGYFRYGFYGVFFTVFIACGGHRSIKSLDADITKSQSAPPPAATLDSFDALTRLGPPEVQLELSDGNRVDVAPRGLVRPKVKIRSVEELKPLFQRVSFFDSEPGDKKTFAKRAGSLPPPQSGDTISEVFPPEASSVPVPAKTNAKKPLQVVRFSPEGPIAVAPNVSVTFSEPMVELTSHANLQRQNVPVSLKPLAKGTWRWVGTKTLLFEPASGRFSKSTRYHLRIAANTRSLLGNTLDKEVHWTFETPSVSVKRAWPNGGVRMPDQTFYMEFDQRITPDAVMEKIRVSTGSSNRVSIKAVAEDQIADKRIKDFVSKAKKNTFVIFRTLEPLPFNSKIQFRLKKGVASQEGPSLSQKEYKYSFRTYGPMELSNQGCGGRTCTPRDTWRISFSNPIDVDRFKPDLIEITPAVPGMTISADGKTIYFSGEKAGRTKYEVRIPRSLFDLYGQPLTKKVKVSFDVGASRPSMRTSLGRFVVLDPSSKPTFTVYSTNYASFSLEVRRVEPEDWKRYTFQRSSWRNDNKSDSAKPGVLLDKRVYTISGDLEQPTQTEVDLSKWFSENDSALALFLTAKELMPGAINPNYEPKFHSWVQYTQIGLDCFVDGEDFLVWASDLNEGYPLKGVRVELGPGGPNGVTGDDGIARLALPKVGQFSYLSAKLGGDTAFLPETIYRTYGGWKRYLGRDSYRWYVFDDRKMYKPGEEVNLKGWLRVVELKKGGDVRIPHEARKIKYSVFGSRGNKITEGRTKTTALGGFDFSFKLPKTPNLGWARVELIFDKARFVHRFQIQEFRTPEFQVKTYRPPGVVVAKSDVTVSTRASYYAGAGLPNAKTRWSVEARPASYTPPNQESFSFGSWVPWWQLKRLDNGSLYRSYEGSTDAMGESHLKLDIGNIHPPRPMGFKASATVMDVNRQAWSSSTSWVVHPALHYPGLRSKKYFVEKNTPLEIEAIVSDVAGNIVAGRPLKMRAGRVLWNWEKGSYRERLVDIQKCDVVTKTTVSKCTFLTEVGGTYKISATTVDDAGRLNFTEITRWVAGEKRPSAKKLEQEVVTLIPDKDVYRPGDTAKILVQSPFAPAEGILSLRRNGLIYEKRFRMDEATTTLEIPIKKNHVPNLIAQVNLVGKTERVDANGNVTSALPKRPAFGMGKLNLKIPPVEQVLDLRVSPSRKSVSPGAKVSVHVAVRDADGAPVENAEVALAVVDEAILALTDYEMVDPVSLFYRVRAAGVRDYHSRSSVRLADPAWLMGNKSTRTEGMHQGYTDGVAKEKMHKSSRLFKSKSGGMPMGRARGEMMLAAEPELAESGGPGAKEGADGLISVRTNLNPLAAFVPAMSTGKLGRVKISFKMPDNLTRYRIMAIAFADKNKFGIKASAVTARLPLMVRPSPPRFLNFGDQFELPVVVQNQTDELKTVTVAARGSNLELTEFKGVEVEVPANDRVEVRFSAKADHAGVARVQVIAASEESSDAAALSLPVWTPATSEAFATYGVVDEGHVVQTVKAPLRVWEQFGGLEVSTSSTALQALTDAFLYLYEYPYSCSEQISSRVLSVAALRDVLNSFGAPNMPSASQIEESMNKDIRELFARQNYDGGFGLWRRGQSAWPFVSLHVIHALLRAGQKGYSLKPQSMNRATGYLKAIEKHIPRWYSESSKWVIRAYALYLRHLSGDKDPAQARELIKNAGGIEGLSFEAIGWIFPLFTESPAYKRELSSIRTFLNNRVIESAGAAHYSTKTTDGDYVILHSDRRADGIILDALIDDQPQSDLIPKLVRGLLAHRKRGRWSNTQDNAFALLALDKYFARYEKQIPDFLAQAWLGDQFIGSNLYKGRTTKRHRIDIPMHFLKKTKKAQNLILQKSGDGRLYYRIGMKYAQRDLITTPKAHGFVVERSYHGVDNPQDVRRRSDGSWSIRSGAKVKVKLTIVAPTRRYHVAVIDSLPAGFEILNPVLNGVEDLPQNPRLEKGYGRWWWWSRPWFEHQNMRDERAEAFTSLLRAGVYTYEYVVRATTPGQFIAPPARAEEMYHPQTYGLSASKVVVIRDGNESLNR